VNGIIGESLKTGGLSPNHAIDLINAIGVFIEEDNKEFRKAMSDDGVSVNFRSGKLASPT